MTSGGGLTHARDGARASRSAWSRCGPAGGAILAAFVAQQRGYRQVLSFDMGGTTAKICLIDDGAAADAPRTFEVARACALHEGQRACRCASR